MNRDAPTTDRLRHEIDQGRGNKAPFPDPAASPLGTDDEAAGTPPSAEAIRTASVHELKPGQARSTRNTDERGRSPEGEETKIAGGMRSLVIFVLAVCALAVVAFVWVG